ncbi:hypothetical protein TcCL_NonESM07680 [Trypanosoma cruzi]|nr:hypothetical protein TcCL_NonESM07680 [Trypanosoma cruzi]
MAVPLRALCGGLLFSTSLPFCVWEGCGRGCVRGSECGWLPASPRALGTSIQVALLDGVSRHPGCSEEEDGEGLLWAEGGWTGQSPSVSFPVLLAAHTESINVSNYRMKVYAALCVPLHRRRCTLSSRCVLVRCRLMREECDAVAAAHQDHLLPLHRPFYFCTCIFFFCFTMNLLEGLWLWHRASWRFAFCVGCGFSTRY